MAEVKLMLLARHVDGRVVESQISKRHEKHRRAYYEGQGFVVKVYEEKVPTPVVVKQPPIAPGWEFRSRHPWVPWLLALLFASVPFGALLLWAAGMGSTPVGR